MNKALLTFLTFMLLGTGAVAQKNKTYHFILGNRQNMEKNLIELGHAEADFWAENLGLDSTMKSRMYNQSFSTFMQMVEIMKSLNYKMEKNHLQEQFNFKIRRERFMKTFLNEAQLATFQKIVNKHAKKELASYSDEPSQEIAALRKLAAGWNVLGIKITYSE